MSDGRFLVILIEVSTSEKKPGMPIPAQSGRQLLDSYKKNLNRLARRTMWMLLFKKMELDESAIMKALLCDNSKFVVFITKKFQIEYYMPIIMLYSDDLP